MYNEVVFSHNQRFNEVVGWATTLYVVFALMKIVERMSSLTKKSVKVGLPDNEAAVAGLMIISLSSMVSSTSKVNFFLV